MFDFFRKKTPKTPPPPEPSPEEKAQDGAGGPAAGREAGGGPSVAPAEAPKKKGFFSFLFSSKGGKSEQSAGPESGEKETVPEELEATGPAAEELLAERPASAAVLEEPSPQENLSEPVFSGEIFEPPEPGPLFEEPLPATPEPGSVFEESIPAPPQTEPVFEESTPAPPQTGPVFEESSPAVLEPGPLFEETVPAPPEPGPIFEESIPAPPQTGPVFEESSPAEPERGPVFEDSIPAPPEPGPVFAESSPAEPESGPLFVETVPAPSKHGPVFEESSPAEPENEPLFVETVPAPSEPGLVFEESSPTEPESGPLFVETVPAPPAPGPVFAESSPAEPENGPLFVETVPAPPEPGPGLAEEAPPDPEVEPVLDSSFPEKSGIEPVLDSSQTGFPDSEAAEEAVPAEEPSVPVPEEAPAPEEPEKAKKGWFSRLKERLSSTRGKIAGRLEKVLASTRSIDESVLEELEEILYTSDLGVPTTESLLERVKTKVARKELKDADALKIALRDALVEMLDVPPKDLIPETPPRVILVVGVNGVGKTTTIAKLAQTFIKRDQTVLLAAGDTFRAAAVEQLRVWSERLGTDFVGQSTGADAAAVVFDAVTAAKARKTDVVIIDTAGRLHTKANLMEELKKIKKVAGKAVPGAPHETILILDANTGQNASRQAQTFNEAVGVDSIIVTKLDGTSKGGVVVSICYELKLPVIFIGIGESYEDLKPFDKEDFANAILGVEPEEAD